MTHRPSVALLRREEYTPAAATSAVFQLLDAIGFHPAPKAKVLLKPNLLQALPSGLVCTHPQVVRAACVYVLEHGASPTVGDSPGFGSALAVAKAVGLSAALADLKVPVVDLDQPVRVKLPFGHRVALSRKALDADCILNLPKLKAHGQLRVTASVKNLFGCIVGVRKAIAHTLHGEKGRRFESLVLELGTALPPTVALLDGITAMHAGGPIHGQPYALGLLAASSCPHALDAAVYTLLGLTPERVPLWREALLRGLPGADLRDIDYPFLSPVDFDATGFQLPETLDPISFNPFRLAKSAARRFLARWLR